jgi:hypothetical protein
MSHESIYRRVRQLLFLAFATFTLAEARAATLTSPSGLSARLDSKTGQYQLITKQPAWTFGGSLSAPLRNVSTSRGKDACGAFQQIAFEWTAGQLPMSGRIRLYEDKSLAIFSQTCGVASGTPPAAFPAFTKIPAKLHVFSYEQKEFTPPAFHATEISTPWLLFDDHADALVISPGSHFMVARMRDDGRSEVASGFNPSLRQVPAGFTQDTVIALGHGINQTWDVWGRAMVARAGVTRPAYDADTVLKYLGYWTDNGAAYYYNYDFSKGYAGTLQALAQRYRDEEIPIRYLQLDSWWYYKTTTDADGKTGAPKKSEKLPAGEWNRYGGLMEYKAHPDLFPNGLDAFQKSIGLPLVTHNRWVDPASPYAQHYKISGVAAVDPKWWDDIAHYLKQSGVATYEQDWLDQIFDHSPAFSSEPGTAEAFLDNMSRACNEQGITLQYCMPYPCYFMQGTRYPNLTTIRTSGDRFNKDRWVHFLYTSRLAASLSIWPWTDVCMSSERENILLSALSAGPVGIGDAMGAETKTNLLHVVRTDGVIVKPDAPLLPLDRSYLADAKNEPAPLISSTYTAHDGIKTEYIFAFARGRASPVTFNLSELGLNGLAYVYDYFNDTAKRVVPRNSFSAPLPATGSAFYVIAPVGKSGIAFLGDKEKFVGTGKQRIASLKDQPGKLTVNVMLAAKEKSVVLHGYAATAPRATVSAGQTGPMQFDPATGHFTIQVNADVTSPTSNSGDPVRQATVVFDTQP